MFAIVEVVIAFLGLIGDFVFGGGVEIGAVSCAVVGAGGNEGFCLCAGFAS